MRTGTLSVGVVVYVVPVCGGAGEEEERICCIKTVFLEEGRRTTLRKEGRKEGKREEEAHLQTVQ